MDVSFVLLMSLIFFPARTASAIEFIPVQIGPLHRITRTIEGLRGRALGHLIRSGMSSDQVTAILGTKHLDSGIRTGATFYYSWHYYSYGLIVSFNLDDQNVMRVTDTRFTQIID